MQSAKEKKRQKILIGVLIIAVLGALIFWYANKTNEADDIATDGQQALNNGELSVESILRNMKIDFSILDDSLFGSLESHGILPVTVTETGRTNPFESY